MNDGVSGCHERMDDIDDGGVDQNSYSERDAPYTPSPIGSSGSRRVRVGLARGCKTTRTSSSRSWSMMAPYAP
jgi:hypothetical protein